ncbi:MAG TPA: signal peptidase I [Mycobacteriales bacterium]|nr:signal peptidase I [Mycobacteriales bacterium]
MNDDSGASRPGAEVPDAAATPGSTEPTTPDARPDDASPGQPSAAAAQSSAEPADSATGHRAKKPKKPRRGSFWKELPVLLVIAFVLAILIKTFLVQAFFIPSASMEKTLHGCPGCSGDRVLVNKLVYRFHDPRPGNVVVFRGPDTWQPEVQVNAPSNPFSKFFNAIGQAIGAAQPSEKDFVKRVIAVGGQTVSCCDEKGRVVVDGRSLDEPYIYQNSPQVNSTVCATGRKFGPIKVPKGRLWVMGDHRNDSADSRCHVDDEYHGTIAVDDVIGKAFVKIWPPSRWDTLGTPATFKDGDAAALLGATPVPFLLGTVAVTPFGLWRHRRRRQRWRAR